MKKRNLILIPALISHLHAYSSSKTTYFHLNNFSSASVIDTYVSDINPSDWVGLNAPNNNFNHKTLNPGQQLKVVEEINSDRSSNIFQLAIKTDDGNTVTARVNMKPGSANAAYWYFIKTNAPNHDLLYYVNNNNVYLSLVIKEDRANWMSHISDNTFVGNLSIPGTHNSATYRTGLPLAQTQYDVKDFTQQLNDGIRFFDFRLRRVDGELKFYHSIVSMDLSYDEVMKDQIEPWLKAHPTETVIILIKEEGDPSGTSESMADLVQREISKSQSRGQTYWENNGVAPTLGEVRGAIVLMRRFGFESQSDMQNWFSKLGISAAGWPDDTTYAIINSDPKFKVLIQDAYHGTVADDKAKVVTKFMDNIRSLDSNKVWNEYYFAINYSSAADYGKCFFTPYYVAHGKSFTFCKENGVYGPLYQALNSFTAHENGLQNGFYKFKGIVAMDYYDDGMTQFIISQNR